jgi:stage II sporulation protein D
VIALLSALAVVQPQPPPSPGEALDDSEDVRILLGRGDRQVIVRGSGLQVWLGAWTPASGEELTATCAAGNLTLLGRGLGDDFASVRATGPLRLGEREVRGSIELRCQGSRWLAINVLPLETYIAAVLGSEMPPTFPMEALRAQAVAARSYALHRKIEAAQQGLLYHLDSTVLSQVYRGLAREDPRTRKAAADTSGEVLAHGIWPVEAYFHASCGGQTESGGAALGRDEPYLASVPCPCARNSPYQHWSLRMTLGEFSRLARSLLGSGEVESLGVSGRTATGRAAALVAQTSDGPRTLQAMQLRALLGYARLPSLWFDVRSSANFLIFEGRGAGHGAGLCQWGARALAAEGKSYREILAHYYPGAELKKIY